MKKMNVMLSATFLLSLSAITQSIDENPTPGRRPSFDATRDSHPLTSLLFWTQASRAEWTADHQGETQIHYGENREVRFGSTGEQAEINRLAAIAPSTNKKTQEAIAAHILMLQSKMIYNSSIEEDTDTPYNAIKEIVTQEVVAAKPAAWTDKKATEAILQGLSGEEEKAWPSARQKIKKGGRRKYKL